MEFKTIETQEQFDAMVKDRIERAKEAARKEFDGFIAPNKVKDLNDQIASLTATVNSQKEQIDKHDQDIADRDAKIKSYETASVKSRVAHELGLPYDSVQFLMGEDEEAIRKSAESFSGILKAQNVAPLASQEPNGKDDVNNAYKQMLNQMNGN